MLQVARRQIIPAIVLTVVFAVFFGLVFPAVVTGIGRVVFPDRSNGSLVKVDGKVVGSALIGQEFLDSKGNPDPRYFQSRPSNAGAGYDPTASGASNLGPGDPRLVGNVPGLNIVGKNPYATPSDPWCLPVQATDKNGDDKTDKAGNPIYEKNPDGVYVCNANTVPERALAYRALNHLSSKVKIPVDAVTSSASGLDPDISPANAMLQAPRVAAARGLPVATVLRLVKSHTNDRQWGFLGDETVNVLDLNLALNRLGN
jgi:potassium-transporting ATPase KdpC subunit